jgi:hypothetical protein
MPILRITIAGRLLQVPLFMTILLISLTSCGDSPHSPSVGQEIGRRRVSVSSEVTGSSRDYEDAGCSRDPDEVVAAQTLVGIRDVFSFSVAGVVNATQRLWSESQGVLCLSGNPGFYRTETHSTTFIL